MGPVPLQVPALGVAEMRVRPDARVSVKTTLFAGDGPLFLTVMLYVEFWPSATALTLVVTPMSPSDGLIDTAPSDQLEVPLKVSDMGTLGAPERVLPAPLTSVPLLPVLRVHCAVWELPTVTVWVPPVVRVSMTMPFTTLGTSRALQPVVVPVHVP